MCDCETTGIVIPVETGEQGEQGGYGGFSARWAWETSTATGPSSGRIRLNNATPASATAIYIHETNADTIATSSFLASFGTSGIVKLFKETDSTIFWMGELTAQTDNGSDRTLTVTYILHNGTFAANDSIVVTFTPKEQGDPGDNGTTILINDVTFDDILNTSTNYVELGTGTVDANTLINNGDKIRVIVNYTKEIPAVKGDTFAHKLVITNDAVATIVYNIDINEEVIGGSTIVEITRRSSSSALIEYKSFFINQLNKLIVGDSAFTRTTAIDFSEDMDFSCQYRNTNLSNTITHEQLTIELLKIQ